MEAGDTFRFGRETHLWVVVSDPRIDSVRVVIINMSTDRGLDPSCILNPGEHPFVEHPTCLRYDMARIVTDADLERYVSSNTIKVRDPVSKVVLSRIRQGAATTEQIPFRCKQVLIEQGLIEP